MLESWLIAWWVLLLAMGWWPCCCDEAEDCDRCEYPAQTPYYMTVILEGMGNGTKANCTSLNGTYVLSQSGYYQNCGWQADILFTVCDGGDPFISLIAAVGRYWLGSVHIGLYSTGSCSYEFTGSDQGDSVDCLNADGTGVHLLSSSPAEQVSDGCPCDSCDHSSATMEVYSGDTT